VIWPVLARVWLPFVAGLTWSRSPLLAKALWVVVLAAFVLYDLRAELRRERQCPCALLARLDRQAVNEGISRNTLIARLIERHLDHLEVGAQRTRAHIAGLARAGYGPAA
jgi:hypothetical protein